MSFEFVLDFLKNNNLELKPTQDTLCFPIIYRIYKKMSSGIKFPNIKVAEELIIDGHHRYLASQLANIKLEIDPSFKTSATAVYDWSEVKLVDEDWDTNAKIRMLNMEDAKYNGLEIDLLNKLLE